jgi:hypothetical protein
VQSLPSFTDAQVYPAPLRRNPDEHFADLFRFGDRLNLVLFTHLGGQSSLPSELLPALMRTVIRFFWQVITAVRSRNVQAACFDPVNALIYDVALRFPGDLQADLQLLEDEFLAVLPAARFSAQSRPLHEFDWALLATSTRAAALAPVRCDWVLRSLVAVGDVSPAV